MKSKSDRVVKGPGRPLPDSSLLRQPSGPWVRPVDIAGRLPSADARESIRHRIERPLQLRVYPDHALRTVAEPVDRFDSEVVQLAEDLLVLMRSRQAIGLTAPQVGAAVRMIVADIGAGPICLVNPEFVEIALRVRDLEGCISLPGITREVKRAALIEVRGYDAAGHRQHFEAKGLLARLIQHEVDHLDGILIVDPERGGGTMGTGEVALERQRQWGGQPAL